MTSVLMLSGCVTLGPKVETRTVIVHPYAKDGTPLKIGHVNKNVKVPVQFVTKEGTVYTDVIDIGGFDVAPPELPNVSAEK